MNIFYAMNNVGNNTKSGVNGIGANAIIGIPSINLEIICSHLQKNRKYSDILTDNTIFNYVTASYLHDIGIISIPDYILNKKTPLNEAEMKILKTHTILGYNLIKENMSQMDHDYLQILCDMTLFHHEHWDGNGYPYGNCQVFVVLALL